MWHVVSAADREAKRSVVPPRLTIPAPPVPSVSDSSMRGIKILHLSNDVNLVQHSDVTG